MMKKIVYFFFFFISGMGWAGVQEVPEKAALCAACHGPTGVSANPLWPSLAGQHKTYLIKQLYDFKADKLRHSPIMAPFVAAMSDEDIQALALFYSQQKLSVEKNSAMNARGEQLYREGDGKKQITACIACHGPAGRGNELAGFPSLSGQRVEYAIQQLQAFKEGIRKNDLNSIMQTISARMSAEDMKAVADYLATLD